ncbi:MAG: hypothetical protein JO005_03020 [Gammaproteobacteria bacterium]|nr:hypothetical protein [Gammaproteobacteria bacterium]
MLSSRWKSFAALGLLMFTLGLKGAPHSPNRPHGCLFVGPDCQAVDPTVVEHPAGNR